MFFPNIIKIIILKQTEVICLFKTKELSKQFKIFYSLKTYPTVEYFSSWRKSNHHQNIVINKFAKGKYLAIDNLVPTDQFSVKLSSLTQFIKLTLTE